jgi:hypothetical protein
LEMVRHVSPSEKAKETCYKYKISS